MKSNWRDDIYNPQLDRNLISVLCNRFRERYRFLGGEEITQFIVEDILEVVEEYRRPLSEVKKGQIVWDGAEVDQGRKPGYGLTMKNTKVKPVVLTLVSEEDIRMLKEGATGKEIRKVVIERIFNEACFGTNDHFRGVHFRAMGGPNIQCVFRWESNANFFDNPEGGIVVPLYFQRCKVFQMQFIAKARFIRCSPFKLRTLAAAIRGKGAIYALNVLKTAALRKAVPMQKMLESAIANAKDRGNVSASQLVVKEIRVDQGPMFRYFKPGAQGRSMPQRKRLSHMSVILESIDNMSGKEV